jgi:hypothetical protein
VHGLVLGAEDQPERNDGQDADSHVPVAIRDVFHEDAQAEHEEHRHEQEEGRVIEALEAGARVVADDGVSPDGGQTAEEEQEPVLRRGHREVEGEPHSKHYRKDMDPVQAAPHFPQVERGSLRYALLPANPRGSFHE